MVSNEDSRTGRGPELKVGGDVLGPEPGSTVSISHFRTRMLSRELDDQVRVEAHDNWMSCVVVVRWDPW